VKIDLFWDVLPMVGICAHKKSLYQCIFGSNPFFWVVEYK